MTNELSTDGVLDRQTLRVGAATIALFAAFSLFSGIDAWMAGDVSGVREVYGGMGGLLLAGVLANWHSRARWIYLTALAACAVAAFTLT